VRSRLVPFRCGSVPASARSLARGRGSFASHGTRLRCTRSEDGWRPACRPLATARSRRVTFHLYKGTKRRRTLAAGSGEKSRSPGRGTHLQWRTSPALPRLPAAHATGRIVPEDLAVTILINSRVARTRSRSSRSTATRSPWMPLPGCAFRTPTRRAPCRLRRHLHGHRVAVRSRLGRHQVLHKR
jgi:hypothetical protein